MAGIIRAIAEQAKRVIEGGKSMTRRRYQRGSLYQRGKKGRRVWVARFYEDVIKSDGSLGRIRRSEVIGFVTEFRTRRQAMEDFSRRLNLVNSGTRRPQSMKKLRDFVREDWEPVVIPTLKFSTQQQYKFLLNLHILPAFGGRRLCELSRPEIQDFLTAKLRSGLSWKTVSLLRGLFGRVLGSTVEWEYLTDNPVRSTKLPRRTGKRKVVILPPDQLQRLADLLPEPTRSLVLLLVLTGMRIGEAFALRWKNIDLAGGVIYVVETVYHGRFDVPKTEKSQRTIPLGPMTVGILTALRGNYVDGEALVFSTRAGKPLDPGTLLRREVEPACKELGLPRITWHSLRHLSATLLDVVGAPLGTVQEILGHASKEITRDTYLHSLPADRRRAVENLEKLVIGPKRTQVDETKENGRWVIN